MTIKTNPQPIKRRDNKLYIAFVCTILSALSGIISYSLSYPNFTDKIIEIVEFIGVGWMIPLLIIVAIILFYIRENWRIPYGYAEFIFGIIFAFSPFLFLEIIPNDYEIQINLLFKIIGGLYIMVRGQDNIAKGYKEKNFNFPRLKSLLKKLKFIG